MTNLLDVQAVTGGYGQMTVLRDLSITVPQGRSVGLLGPNGHGKTTLLRTISGLQRATAGSIVFDGTDIGRLSPRAIVDLGLVHIPQGCRLFPQLTVRENLVLGAHNPRARKAGVEESLEQVYSLFPKLAQRSRQWGATLSGGERQMVAIGMGLMAKPTLLLLDEPTLGLSPKVKEELLERIAEVRATGLSLLLIDGDVDFVMSLTDHYYVVEMGTVVRDAESTADVERTEMMDLYFGGDSGAPEGLAEEIDELGTGRGEGDRG